MKNNWSERGCFGFLVFGILLGISCDDQSLEHQRIIEACEKVRIGDTEQVVRALIGEPLNIHNENGNLGKGRALEYWAPAIVASSPSIHIDESGHVDSISCHESHHLRKDQPDLHQNIEPSNR